MLRWSFKSGSKQLESWGAQCRNQKDDWSTPEVNTPVKSKQKTGKP